MKVFSDQDIEKLARKLVGKSLEETILILRSFFHDASIHHLIVPDHIYCWDDEDFFEKKMKASKEELEKSAEEQMQMLLSGNIKISGFDNIDDILLEKEAEEKKENRSKETPFEVVENPNKENTKSKESEEGEEGGQSSSGSSLQEKSEPKEDEVKESVQEEKKKETLGEEESGKKSEEEKQNIKDVIDILDADNEYSDPEAEEYLNSYYQKQTSGE